MGGPATAGGAGQLLIGSCPIYPESLIWRLTDNLQRLATRSWTAGDAGGVAGGAAGGGEGRGRGVGRL